MHILCPLCGPAINSKHNATVFVLLNLADYGIDSIAGSENIKQAADKAMRSLGQLYLRIDASEVRTHTVAAHGNNTA